MTIENNDADSGASPSDDLLCISTANVLEILHSYRCTMGVDEEGCGMPIADFLATAMGCENVGEANEELYLLADFIAGELVHNVKVRGASHDD